MDDREFMHALVAPLKLLLSCARRGRMDAVIACARHILSLIESRDN